MASVTPQPPSSELLVRAAEAIDRSQELCAATRRLIEEIKDEIATARARDRQLETALQERKRVSVHVRGTLRVGQESSPHGHPLSPEAQYPFPHQR